MRSWCYKLYTCHVETWYEIYIYIYIYICMSVCMYVCIKKQMHYFEVFCSCMLRLIRNLITPFKCHNHADVSLDSYATGKLLCAEWHLPPQLWIISFFFLFLFLFFSLNNYDFIETKEKGQPYLHPQPPNTEGERDG